MATALNNWPLSDSLESWTPLATAPEVEPKVSKPALKIVPAPGAKREVPQHGPLHAPSARTIEKRKRADRDAVILEHLPLVRAIAIRVHESLPVHVEVDDLVHSGVLGLIDAASKFDPEKQVAFSSYAKYRIKGAILDSLRQLDWASRDLRRRHKRMEAAVRELSSELQRVPNEAELAERLGVEVERWRQMALELRCVGLISGSTRNGDQDELPAPEFAGSVETRPDSMCVQRQRRTMLDGAMNVLSERYRKVIVLYYNNEMTMKEIGEKLGINESRVSQIHKAALEKMQVVFRESGVRSSRAV